MTLTPPRRTTRDYLLPIFIIIALGLIAVLAVKLFFQMSGGADPLTLSSAGKATLVVDAGEVEVYLPAAQSWKIVTAAHTTLASGEMVRTAATGRASLTLDDGTHVVLDGATQLMLADLATNLRGASATLTLVDGAVWVDATRATKGTVDVSTSLLGVSDADGAYLFSSVEDGANATVSVVSGGANVRVFDPERTDKKVLKALDVTKGNTVALTARRVNLLRLGGDMTLVKPTGDEVTTTPFYIAQTSGMPTTVDATIPSDTLTSTTKPTTTSPAATTDSATEPTTKPTIKPSTITTLSAPVVTSPRSGSVVVNEPLELRGVVSPDVAKVEVVANGGTPYTLASFKAGSGNFLYRASTKLGNLVNGRNIFIITAIDADGNRSTSTTASYQFTAGVAPTTDTNATPTTSTTPSTTSATTTATSTGSFVAPIVTSPASGAIFTTGPVRITGTVAAGTTSVSVNGYALTKYVTGSLTWYYTADTKYDNLKMGTNAYDITATNADGTTATTTLTITYTPADTSSTTTSTLAQ